MGLKACFVVRLEKAPEPGPDGLDQVEFMIAPNPGEPPRPLARTASGGELSRLMLTMLSLFSRFEPVPTLIFDEIDAGLGARRGVRGPTPAGPGPTLPGAVRDPPGRAGGRGRAPPPPVKSVEDGRTTTRTSVLEGEAREPNWPECSRETPHRGSSQPCPRASLRAGS